MTDMRALSLSFRSLVEAVAGWPEAASRGLHRPDVQERLACSALAHVPGLPTAVQLISQSLAADGHAVVGVPGLAALPHAQRDAVVIAVSALIGRPSPVGETTSLLVWDVRPRLDLPAAQRSANVSTSSGEACLHTDSTFAPVPERWFGLWCVQPAKDGGANVLVDARRVVGVMATEPGAQAALELLRSNDVPLWNGRSVQPVRVLGGPGQPLVRYREDLVAEGLRRAGLGPTHLLTGAVDTFSRMLATSRCRTRIRLAADEVLFVDNHRTVHAREHFADPARHLLRVRMFEGPVVPV
ncbi:TauD/TfdA family dioxygenase [Micromonospora carbonacea]|uniref:TauD/TfdA family dioxygenase n=1 Tax=Micromonospora carbonacea TaxID=47853 RepID=UPI003716099D